ncbi:potassium channel subfamily K member 13-like isoform X1 [Centruroides vittatus]|uniref:potassium channel subfamily K member 13-like isoform X1 n=1 Tax=Centruroides vittatus TaxID=120091 RepID=UPI00350F37AE
MDQKGRCCTVLHLGEENARLLLLAVVMVIYMIIGAAVFQILEQPEEEQNRQRFLNVYRNFWSKYNNTIDMQDVLTLLYEYGNATAAGVIDKRQRWDFSGSFYFVGTVVSTIGFGMTTPKTIYGRITVIIYGFLGCSGAILFFNLFLERIITLMSTVLRSIHERELRRRMFGSDNGRRDSQISFDDHMDDWKPSVYWVLLCLTVATTSIATTASALYSTMENWSYFESLYFCFVAFSTVGFGDLVPSDQTSYHNSQWYRFANFWFLVAGCCCFYSLFNVMSIVIKQFINWLMKLIDCRLRCRRIHKSPPKPAALRKRRNALTPDHLKRQQKTADDSDSYDSDERRDSGEMISMQGFLRSNKVSLAVMQKQLYESAQRGHVILLPSRIMDRDATFKPGSVGPLALVSQKLGEDVL